MYLVKASVLLLIQFPEASAASEGLAPRVLRPTPSLAQSAAPRATPAAMAEEDRVAVFGATGRVGQMVTKKLLDDGRAVTAVVRSADKAADVLPTDSAQLECRVVDLATATDETLKEACAGAGAAIWCASGFTDGGESIDVRGMRSLSGAFPDASAAPKVVMLSSAGITRTAWSDEKKARLDGAADIPIVRLNPGGILEKKVEAEQVLRDSGQAYCIVRPTGLKFEGWPAGRPLFSQGDVAVGRTNPQDLVDVLVGALGEEGASGKTFEMFTVTGYPAPRELAPALARLQADAAGPLDEASVDTSYDLLQQLLPGEEQDATRLEMGRTYEEVDSGAVSREPGAPATARERELAASVVEKRGGLRGALRGLRGRLGR